MGVIDKMYLGASLPDPNLLHYAILIVCSHSVIYMADLGGGANNTCIMKVSVTFGQVNVILRDFIIIFIGDSFFEFDSLDAAVVQGLGSPEIVFHGFVLLQEDQV